jgi:hypothetical protein
MRARLGQPALAGLVAVLVAGLALRVLLAISLWPVSITIDDAYESYARTNPFEDPLHPAGYSLILAAIGAVSRQVAVTVTIQHGVGLASAVLLWAAVRRVTGSPWVGLLPAAMVALSPDGIVLEHAIMSESWATLATSAGMYAAARAFRGSRPWWAATAGATLAVSATIRTAGLPVILVAAVAVWLASRSPRRWLPAVAVLGGAAAVLVPFAVANATFGPRLGITPAPGWYLYGRAAQFADCSNFTPPAGTRVLCERRRPSARPGAYYYLFDPKSPALTRFGPFGSRDPLIGGWSRRAIIAQPGDYLTSVWQYLRVYWVPSWEPPRRLSGGPLDPGLDPGWELNVFFQGAIEERLKTYYDSFTRHKDDAGLDVFRGWQELGRFGGTLLTVTTLLTGLGLIISRGLPRAGVLLFGLGGLALIVSPALSGTYVGRYVVPMAGPMVAAAAIAVHEAYPRIGTRAGPISRQDPPAIAADR